MATINDVGVTLSGQTGTGNFVGSNSPTLVTPTLGVASATSINFGGSTLSTYLTSTAFTPIFTCATPGDLSVTYATQTAFYEQFGNIVLYTIVIIATPTFTTASGQIIIGGLPSNPNSTYGIYVGVGFTNSAIIFPVGTTQIYTTTSGLTSSIGLAAMGSATPNTPINMTSITSGVAFNCSFSGWYFV